jgi:hypothetical protein
MLIKMFYPINQRGILSFNCPKKDKQDWKPIAKEIMHSLMSK